MARIKRPVTDKIADKDLTWKYDAGMHCTEAEYFKALHWCIYKYGEPWNSILNSAGTWNSYEVEGPSPLKSSGDPNRYAFIFKKQADATIFKLTWC